MLMSLCLQRFHFPFSKSLFKSQWFLCQCSPFHHCLSLGSGLRLDSVQLFLLYQYKQPSGSILSFLLVLGSRHTVPLICMYSFFCLKLYLICFSSRIQFPPSANSSILSQVIFFPPSSFSLTVCPASILAASLPSVRYTSPYNSYQTYSSTSKKQESATFGEHREWSV